MPFPLQISFGTQVVQFEDYPEGISGEFWIWKLDTFRTMKKEEADIIIASNIQENMERIDDASVLSSEITGFFERVVWKGKNEGINWSFRRKSTGKEKVRYCVNKDWNRIELVKNEKQDGFAAFEYLAQITPGIALKEKMLTIHSALMEYNGEAIAISAASGVGKTTHARLWREHRNALILNGDRMVCKRTQSGWTAYGTPWSGTSGEQINRSAPLKAFVVLQRGEENSVRRLTPMEAFPHILGQLLCPMWDRQLAETAMDELNQFLSDIPVYLLTCRPDQEAVDCLYHAVWEDEK